MRVVARRFVMLSICLSTAWGQLPAFGHDDDGCEPPRRYSDEWWAQEADSPVGARQKCKKGKAWPPYPRPVGHEQTCTHKFHAAHYWPWPYNCDDRRVVRQFVSTQEANGWLTETTLYDYHFNPDSNELTTPGKLHLQWILQSVPVQYRSIWVQNSDDESLSQVRLNSVKNAATRMVGANNLPPIALRLANAPKRPAIEIDIIRRRELETIPEPRIPLNALPTGTGGGGEE